MQPINLLNRHRFIGKEIAQGGCLEQRWDL
jgi:hypothetical protein